MTTDAPTFVSLEEIERALTESADRRSKTVFDPKVEAQLARLRPFAGWEEHGRALLNQMSVKLGEANPAGWDNSTRCQKIGTLCVILSVCEAAGVRVADFEDLLASKVLAALHRRVCNEDVDHEAAKSAASTDDSNHSPSGRPCGYFSLGGLLKSLRTMVNVMTDVEIPAEMRQMIAFCSDLRHRRDLSDRILPWVEYLAGAKALEAVSRLAFATGRQKEGEEYGLMARVLSIALNAAARRSEFAHAKRDRIYPNLMADKPEFDIYVEAKTSKTRRGRILTIDEPFAVRSLEEASQGPGGARLFRQTDGQPLSPSQLYDVLRKATMLAVGVPASFNILRKVNTAALETPEARSWQLAHGEGSDLARTTYHPNLAAQGRAKLARARDEYARRALKAIAARETGGNVDSE